MHRAAELYEEEQQYTHMQLKMGIRETFFFWRKNFNQPNILQVGCGSPTIREQMTSFFKPFMG